MREQGGQEGVDIASIQNLDKQSSGSVAATMLVQYYQQVPLSNKRKLGSGPGAMKSQVQNWLSREEWAQRKRGGEKRFSLKLRQ